MARSNSPCGHPRPQYMRPGPRAALKHNTASAGRSFPKISFVGYKIVHHSIVVFDNVGPRQCIPATRCGPDKAVCTSFGRCHCRTLHYTMGSKFYPQSDHFGQLRQPVRVPTTTIHVPRAENCAETQYRKCREEFPKSLILSILKRPPLNRRLWQRENSPYYSRYAMRAR